MKYPSSARLWLEQWDRGDIVWTVEMGGLGPDYELAIQGFAAEIIRHLMNNDYDTETWKTDVDAWKRDRRIIRDATLHQAKDVSYIQGLSGTQADVAIELGVRLFLYSPQSVLSQESLKDRIIQVTNPSHVRVK